MQRWSYYISCNDNMHSQLWGVDFWVKNCVSHTSICGMCRFYINDIMLMFFVLHTNVIGWVCYHMKVILTNLSHELQPSLDLVKAFICMWGEKLATLLGCISWNVLWCLKHFIECCVCLLTVPWCIHSHPFFNFFFIFLFKFWNGRKYIRLKNPIPSCG